jgi:HD-GYP domain-containing protein (c-di-GMP phosphodiesterase class II)
MEGIIFDRRGAAVSGGGGNEAVTALLAKQGSLEIMSQNIGGESVVWLTPASDPQAIEFFFIHEGGVELALDDGPVTLGQGDSFMACGLKRDIPVKMQGDTKILYVTNCPSFESVSKFEESLNALLMRINEKDHYTYQHNGAVLKYSLCLFDVMETSINGVSRDDLGVAALFHDVGKCFIPVEILQKPESLEPLELRYILRHSVDSGRLLKSEFGEQIAEIAMNHHERLDGSGYPKGLTEEDISVPSRIVAVADAFDAMTTDRGYNKVKTFEQAAEELVSLNEKFDSKVTETLLHLVESGAIQTEGKEANE